MSMDDRDSRDDSDDVNDSLIATVGGWLDTMRNSNNGCLQVLAYVLAFLLLLGGFAVIVGKVHDIHDSPGWPSVEGNLIASNVATRHHTRKDGDRYVDYAILVEYTYRLDGKNYENNRLCLDPPAFHSWVFAKAELDKKWVPGTRVPVYYDPKNPSSSVLVPGLYDPPHTND